MRIAADHTKRSGWKPKHPSVSEHNRMRVHWPKFGQLQFSSEIHLTPTTVISADGFWNLTTTFQHWCYFPHRIDDAPYEFLKWDGRKHRTCFYHPPPLSLFLFVNIFKVSRENSNQWILKAGANGSRMPYCSLYTSQPNASWMLKYFRSFLSCPLMFDFRFCINSWQFTYCGL